MNMYERIRKRRLELNMTQEELAIRAGYTSRSSINKIEAGVIDLPESKITAIAKALNVTEAYLMGWEDDVTLDLPDYFETAQEAMQFLLAQPAIMGYGGFDVRDLSEEQSIEFANEVLSQIKLVSYKYKK